MEEATWEREDTMRTAYPFLFEDEGTLFSHVVIEEVYACVVYGCMQEFRDEIILRGRES